MLGLDDWIAGLAAEGGIALALLVAVLLGLRHATDPDHLTAVSTLVASDERRGSRRAAILGLAWGVGHGLTLFAIGLPVVLFGALLPGGVHSAAEVAIGAVIVGLAVRLLVRWRRGYFHVHLHRHGAVRHAHPHVHEHARRRLLRPDAHARHGAPDRDARSRTVYDPAHRADHGHPGPDHAHRTDHSHLDHDHAHPAEQLGRSPATALAIGLVHGVGGSAGLGILLVGAIPDELEAVVALLLFAAATALSMALLSTGFGYALARGPVVRRLRRVVPVLGSVSLLFGAWYTLGALELLPYAF